jgi:small subunit ribosomal protein S13
VIIAKLSSEKVKLGLFVKIQNINKDKVNWRQILARIAGIDLPKNKKILFGLPYIFGVGKSNALDILTKANVDPNKKVSDLTADEVAAIRAIITSDIKVEGALRSEVQMNIKRLMDIGAYRGKRHQKGLPVRGQRTRTNSRTRKGKRKTVAGKKKAAAKK